MSERAVEFTSSEVKHLRMLLRQSILLLTLTQVLAISPPDCTDGSLATCTCGDGSEPDYNTFPPCPIKKVKHVSNYSLGHCPKTNIILVTKPSMMYIVHCIFQK